MSANVCKGTSPIKVGDLLEAESQPKVDGTFGTGDSWQKRK